MQSVRRRSGWSWLLAISLAALGCKETASDPTRAPESPGADLDAPPTQASVATSQSAAPSPAATGSSTADPDGSGGAVAGAAPSLPAAGDPSSPASSSTAASTATASASSSAGVQTERGATSRDAAYSTWLEASNPYPAGKPGAVRAVLVAGKGYKCNEKYPFKFKLDAPPAGLSYPSATARGIQFGAQRSVLPVPFVPERPGTYTISGTFSLSVCTPESCKIQRQALAVTVRVDP